MNKKEVTPKPKNTLRTFVLFCLIVGTIIIVSLAYRVFLIIKNSSFDGGSGFIVAVVENDRKKAAIYSVDPTAKSESVLFVNAAKGILPHLTQALSIPLDGEVTVRVVHHDTRLPLPLASGALYAKSRPTDLTIIDMLRLRWFAQSISEKQITTQSVTVPLTPAVKDPLSSLFIDSRLTDEKQTIAIVNGTDVSGFGGRLEKVITHIGGTVISITTSPKPLAHSRIVYSGEKSYTVNRLQKILGFSLAVGQKTALSDIIIELGQDSAKTQKF